MPLPIICSAERLQQYLKTYRHLFSKPQYKYFVTVLLGFIQCQGTRTLSGLRRCVAQACSLSSLSRFLAQAPWDAEALAEGWQAYFRRQMGPVVQAELSRQQAEQSGRRGRPQHPVVTGCVIGDDSTMHKHKGRKMEGLGHHYATTHKQGVRGHSLVQGLYVLVGRQCPSAPGLYRQQAVCSREQVPFKSKLDLMRETIQSFEPVAGTLTHVVLDSWYSAKVIWKAARERQFLITTGVKSNRCLRVEDASQPTEWHWQRLNDYAAHLRAEDYLQLVWPRGEEPETVYVHVVSTRVRKLYRGPVVIIRRSLQDPLSQARYWASSDLDASPERLVEHISAWLRHRGPVRGWQGRVGSGSVPTHERYRTRALLELSPACLYSAG